MTIYKRDYINSVEHAGWSRSASYIVHMYIFAVRILYTTVVMTCIVSNVLDNIIKRKMKFAASWLNGVF
jgi:hypothetical protein